MREARTLYVGGLAPNTTNAQIKALNDAIKAVRRNDRSKFAHVVFNSEAEAETAYAELKKAKVGGASIKVDYSGEKSRNIDASSWAKDKETRPVNPLCLYVGNLPEQTTTKNVSAMFPSSTSCRIASNKSRKTGIYAFVTFETEQDARAAFNQAGTLKMKGRLVDVVYARVTEDKPTKASPAKPTKTGEPKQKLSKKQLAAQAAAAESNSEDDDDEEMDSGDEEESDSDGMLDNEAAEADSDEDEEDEEESDDA